MAGELSSDTVGEQAVRLLGTLGVKSQESRRTAQRDFEAWRLAWQGFIERTLPMVARVIDVQGAGIPVPEPYKRKSESGELTDLLPPERYTVHDVISDGQVLSVLVRLETDVEGKHIYNIDPLSVEVAEDVDKAILAIYEPRNAPKAE